MDDCLKKSQPANPPNACGEILTTSTDIKQYCRFFKPIKSPSLPLQSPTSLKFFSHLPM
jgi:hypothetical protein